MAIKELFQDDRPEILFDPRASRRIDPRFKYTRNSAASYTDNFGLLRPNAASAGQPRHNYDSDTKEYLGLLLEPSRTNVAAHSGDVSQWVISNMTATGNSITLPTGDSSASVEYAGTDTTPNPKYVRCVLIAGASAISAGETKTFSVFLRAGTENNVFAVFQNETATEGTGSLFDLSTGAFVGNQNKNGVVSVARQATKLANGWYRVSLTCTFPSASNIAQAFIRLQANSNVVTATTSFSVWGSQVETGPDPTSYIPTTTSAVTRAADILTIDTNLPSPGTIFVDSRAAQVNDGDVITSLANASNQKLNLALQSLAATYNSLALVASYSGTTKTSLPLTVPTLSRERNIVTWGTQNYQYGQSYSRFAPSLASSVPINMNRISIGSDAVDPTKAFNGHINRLYIWAGEMAPAVAEALVRGELDPINADTYSPTGPTGSLALIVNTQGAASDGDKTFTLPAESALNDNDIVITWGDGTESGLDGASAELGAPGLTHTYPAAGIYPVWVEGQLENLQFGDIANAPDLLQIAAWGTNADGNDVFRSPSTMRQAFYGCSQMNFSASARTTNLPDTSAVKDWFRAFRDCSSITGTFPAFNFSAATTFQDAFYGCSGLTSFTAAGDQTQNVTNFTSAWYNCPSLTSFPLINTAAGTNFSYAWGGCTGLTSFPEINTAAGTNFYNTWRSCIGLTSFPLINTAAGTNFSDAWRSCIGLTSFPLINTAAGTNFSNAWRNCTGLTSFPLINTSSGTTFFAAWDGCSSLTAFPLLNTASGTDFTATWRDCTSLTSFPLVDVSSGVTFLYAWFDCTGLTSFPLLDFSSAAGLSGAWYGCISLTSFPLIDSSNCADFSSAWLGCSGLTSFPIIDTSNGINFGNAWKICTGLTSFPALNFDSATGSASDASSTFTGFRETWYNCTSLTDFPADRFNSTTCTRYLDAWTGCALTAQSIENILVSINTANTSNGNLGIGGGTNAAKTTWSTAANNAYDALILRGWTITYNA